MSAPHHDTLPDFTLPAFDLRSVARRAALPLALAGAAVLVWAVAGGRFGFLGDALDRAASADPSWLAVAPVAELASFGGYIALLWLVGRRATDRLGLRASAEITLGGAAATRLLPTAGACGVAATLWALARTGLGARAAGRLLLTFLVLLYGVFLAGIAVSGTAVALDGHVVAGAAGAGAATVAIAIGLVLGLRGPELPGRLGAPARALGGAVADALGLLRRGDGRLLGAPAWWAFDAAVLWAAFHALGEPPALAVLAFAYFAGQLGNTLPLPGAASGGMVGVLLAFGVAPDLALPSVLLYRTVAIWLPAPLGLAALAGLRARIARWDREDAGTPPRPDRARASALTPAPVYAGSACV